VACDNGTPYHVSGTMQDLGSVSGPTNSLATSGIPLSDWHDIGGGESGFTVPDPSEPDVIYAGEYGGYISRYDHRTRQARNVSIYPTNPSGHGALDLRYRFQWTAPIMVSPHDPKVIYHGANVLFKTRDGGRHWQAISPDLTRNDKSKQKWSGGPISGDNTGAEYYCTIFALAESPRQAGVLWAGSDDGLVHVSTDGGKHWADVTKNIPEMPQWGTVSCIEASPFDAATAYVVVDAHRLDDMRPYLFRTADYGKTWARLSTALPQDVYLHAVREDPRRKGLLYAATEHGVAFSRDGGAAWKELKLNLPTVGVNDLVVKGDDLVLATNGRSLWVFDDLTPVRDLAPRLASRAVHLFPVQPTVRWRYHHEVEAPQQKQPGENPPEGALINYSLKARPSGPISLEVLDAHGTAIRTLSSILEPDEVPPDDPDAKDKPPKKTVLTTHPGVNRVAWDLCYAGPAKIPHAKIDAGELDKGPLVNPGTYTIKLTADGQTVTSEVDVKPDPRVHLTPSRLEAQRRFGLAVRDDITRLSGMVAQIRAVRSQLAQRNELLKDNARAAPLIKSTGGLIAKLDALEARLHNPKAEITYDILAQRGGAMLYSQLGLLFESVKDSDGAPTQGMREVYAEEARELKEREQELSGLVNGDLAKVGEMAKHLGIPAVIVPKQRGAIKSPAAAKAPR